MRRERQILSIWFGSTQAHLNEPQFRIFRCQHMPICCSHINWMISQIEVNIEGSIKHEMGTLPHMRFYMWPPRSPFKKVEFWHINQSALSMVVTLGVPFSSHDFSARNASKYHVHLLSTIEYNKNNCQRVFHILTVGLNFRIINQSQLTRKMTNHLQQPIYNMNLLASQHYSMGSPIGNKVGNRNTPNIT